tara:strand:- start:940 stop:1521 length:582 start_codon:yes stop_codon:yes gene_type:complete
MRKLPKDLENPVDNLIYKIVEFVAPTLYEYGFTPNILTTLGNIFTLAFAYFMLNYHFRLAALFYLLSYIFDCLDGYVARSYKMTTQFGDWYDHISDTIRTIILFYTLLKINKKWGIYAIMIILMFILLSFIHLSHQEIYYDKPEKSRTLNMLRFFNCGANKYNVHEYLNISKYLGCGTSYLITIFIIFFYKKG